MPTLLKISICSLCVFVVGVIFAFWAPAVDGWQSVRNFAIGTLIAATGLILSILTSAISAIIRPLWRRMAVGILVVSLLLLAGSILIWRMA